MDVAGASATVADCVFDSNHSKNEDGGVYLLNSDALVKSTRLLNNESTFGGAVSNKHSDSVFANCLFRTNFVNGFGGGLYSTNSAPLLINCAFLGNEASRGGGVYMGTAQAYQIINCSLATNRGTNRGGALYDLGAGSSIATITNTVIWQNTHGPSGTPTDQTSSMFLGSPANAPAFSHCLIMHWTANDLNDPANSLDGTTSANDPQFIDPFADLRLPPGSPALDVGLNAANRLPTDLAGNVRIQISTIDIGAYEPDLIGSLWLTDADMDGTPWGIENAIGSDPNNIVPGDTDNLLTPGGNAVLTFGRNPNASPYTTYVVERSPDLTLNSFAEIYRFTGSETSETLGAGVSSSIGSTLFTITDANPPAGKAFYRLRVDYAP